MLITDGDRTWEHPKTRLRRDRPHAPNGLGHAISINHKSTKAWKQNGKGNQTANKNSQQGRWNPRGEKSKEEDRSMKRDRSTYKRTQEEIPTVTPRARHRRKP